MKKQPESPVKIAPSILDANFQNLQSEIDSLATADRIHLDIMDGNFVPNLSFGASILSKIDFPTPIEAHLMVENPENYFDQFQKLGVEGITFHAENTGSRAIEFLKNLKSRGLRAGICVDGFSKIEILPEKSIEIADQILLMSVKAGFGGQKFLPEVLEKIKILRAKKFRGEIEVDGGITLENAKKLKFAGADVVVVGSFLMKKPAKNRRQIIRDFRELSRLQ